MDKDKELTEEEKKKLYIKTYFQYVKPHVLTLEGEWNQYSIYLNPQAHIEHRYTLILLHDTTETAYEHYKWIKKELPDFFGDYSD